LFKYRKRKVYVKIFKNSVPLPQEITFLLHYKHLLVLKEVYIQKSAHIKKRKVSTRFRNCL